MNYWRNPEVIEAEKELERLHGEAPLFVSANKALEDVTVSLPEDPPPFPAQRQNRFPMGGLEGVPTASVAQESELPLSVQIWSLY